MEIEYLSWFSRRSPSEKIGLMRSTVPWPSPCAVGCGVKRIPEIRPRFYCSAACELYGPRYRPWLGEKFHTTPHV